MIVKTVKEIRQLDWSMNDKRVVFVDELMKGLVGLHLRHNPVYKEFPDVYDKALDDVEDMNEIKNYEDYYQALLQLFMTSHDKKGRFTKRIHRKHKRLVKEPCRG